MAKKSKNNTPAKKTQVTQQQITASQFSGPIPPPSILGDYDQVVPGAAERILIMAEKNADHQREMEKTALNEGVKATKRGQLYGLIIGLTAFLTVMFTSWIGCEKAASIVGGTTVVGLVAVFVIGRVWSPHDSPDESNNTL